MLCELRSELIVGILGLGDDIAYVSRLAGYFILGPAIL